MSRGFAPASAQRRGDLLVVLAGALAGCDLLVRNSAGATFVELKGPLAYELLGSTRAVRVCGVQVGLLQGNRSIRKPSGCRLATVCLNVGPTLRIR